MSIVVIDPTGLLDSIVELLSAAGVDVMPGTRDRPLASEDRVDRARSDDTCEAAGCRALREYIDAAEAHTPAGVTVVLASSCGAEDCRRHVVRAVNRRDFPAVQVVVVEMCPVDAPVSRSGAQAVTATGIAYLSFPYPTPFPWPHVDLAAPIVCWVATSAVCAAVLSTELDSTKDLVWIEPSSAVGLLLSESIGRLGVTGADIDPLDRRRVAQAYVLTARDGLQFAIHLSAPEKFWDGLVRTLDDPALAADPRFTSAAGRRDHYDELNRELLRVAVRRDRHDWLARLRASDVPVAPVNTYEEAAALTQELALSTRGFRITP